MLNSCFGSTFASGNFLSNEKKLYVLTFFGWIKFPLACFLCLCLANALLSKEDSLILIKEVLHSKHVFSHLLILGKHKYRSITGTGLQPFKAGITLWTSLITGTNWLAAERDSGAKLVIKGDPPGAWMVFNEVPGSREVFTGEVSTHSWKCHFHVFLGDFASRRVQTKTDDCNTVICMMMVIKKTNYTSLF